MSNVIIIYKEDNYSERRIYVNHIKVEIKRILIADDGKSFNIGDDIAFTYNAKRYIGEIVDMTKDNLILTRIECRGI